MINENILKSGFIIVLITIITFTACKKERQQTAVLLTPHLPAQPYDYDIGDDRMVSIGRILFYDKHLSANNSIACGSCHVQAFGFSDARKLSSGVANKLTHRNTPGITSESQIFGLFWDARASDFKDLVLRPILNHDEMGVIDIDKLPAKLMELGYYDELFTRVYGNSEITVSKIQSCLSMFLNALVRPHQTEYEQGSQVGYKNFDALEMLGKNIFFEQGKCSQCHNLSGGWFSSANIGLELSYADQGMGELSGSRFGGDGVFRVPNLINIAVTAPYMHDGRFKTLDEVVEHYNSGVQDHPNLSWNLKETATDQFGNEIGQKPQRLNLSSTEKKALVAFLNTLTDEQYLKDIKYSNPFIQQ